MAEFVCEVSGLLGQPELIFFARTKSILPGNKKNAINAKTLSTVF